MSRFSSVRGTRRRFSFSSSVNRSTPVIHVPLYQWLIQISAVITLWANKDEESMQLID